MQEVDLMSEETLLEDIAPDVELPPTQDDLPSDDGIPMETQRHKLQMDLLIYPLRPWLQRHPDGAYVGGNMFVYFSLEQVRHQDFRGPDVFVVLGVADHERKSWVVWEEGKGPDIVIELLSDKTADKDKGAKKIVYQDQLRASEYFWFDPFNPDDWAGFELHYGVYRALSPDSRGHLVSERLGLKLVRWHGNYEGVEATWLRWMTPEGELLTTPPEAQAMAERRAEAEAQRAEAEARRADAAEAEIARLKSLLAAQSDSPSGR
jgi:Uma2 family endonuclease